MSEIDRYQRVRSRTVALAELLEIEDMVVQSMPDASPTKWHLAHTTWFFETFVVQPNVPKYRSPNPAFAVLFNSYYNGVGEQFPRHLRGTVSRPTVSEVMAWRAQVDEAMASLLSTDDPELATLITIGLHHEEQHQELLVTDIKHALVQNPAFDHIVQRAPSHSTPEFAWREYASQTFNVGHSGDGFFFDNERPNHETLLQDFAIANRVVSNREYLEFIDAGGYQQHQWWLSDAWTWLEDAGISSPLYWKQVGDTWVEQRLSGACDLDLDAPVTHVSFFEADAYARFRNARLPTEFEWERFASDAREARGVFSDDFEFQPTYRGESDGLWDVFGSAWEWTSSAYRPYPGYKAPPGAIGEYNGKFMNGQYVLKGGSCATPSAHIRATYRNFFGPEKRWQYTGIRLAEDR